MQYLLMAYVDEAGWIPRSAAFSSGAAGEFCCRGRDENPVSIPGAICENRFKILWLR
jgi:hypothetical protein